MFDNYLTIKKSNIILRLILAAPLLSLSAIFLHYNSLIFSAALALAGIITALSWLIKLNEPRSFIGFLILLTLVRPMPKLGNSLISGRLVDAVWFIIAILVFIISIELNRQKPKFWSSIVWLIIMTLSITFSIFNAVVVMQQDFVFRDLFELYRGPYYILILLLSSRIPWTGNQLRKYFYEPLLVGIWLVFAISVMQGFRGWAGSLIEIIYSPKSMGYNVLDLLSSGTSLRIRNSGSFGNPNYYAVVLAITIPFLFAAFYMVHKTLSRFVLIITIIISFIFLLSTGSRTGWIAAIISITSYFLWSMLSKYKRLYNRVRGTKKTGKYFVSIAIILIVIIILFMPRLERLNKTLYEIQIKGIQEIGSFKVKTITGLKFVSEAFIKSPILGLGPLKSIDTYLGDNQYTKLFTRYGIIGMISWWGFWISIYISALKLRKRAKSDVQRALNHAILSIVPSFLVACIGGAFFDATQISTVLLLFIGIAYSGSIINSSKNG